MAGTLLIRNKIAITRTDITKICLIEGIAISLVVMCYCTNHARAKKLINKKVF